MSDPRPLSTVHNILNGKVKTAAEYRVGNGWTLPVTTPHDVAFALKAARAPRRGDLRSTIAALTAIGRDGTWIDDDGLAEVVRHTGCTMKHLLWLRSAMNRWLSGLDEYVAGFGEIDEHGRLRIGKMSYSGGRTTAMVLAGDDFGLAPWILTHALLADARILAKPSSVEPLSTYLFAKAAAEKGLNIPGVICLDTSQERDVQAIIDLVAHSEQSVVFGEDRTVEAIYRKASLVPPHKAIPYWSGRSGAIVLPDADPAAAADGIIQGATLDRGNKCISTKKVFAPRAMAEQLERHLIAAADRLTRGSPFEPDTDLGPEDEWARTMAERAAASGTIFYDRDLILARCDNDHSQLMREEIPYPLVGIRYYEDEDPVELANASVRETPAGRALNMAVFTADVARYREVAGALLASKVMHDVATTTLDPLRSHQAMHAFIEMMRPSEVC